MAVPVEPIIEDGCGCGPVYTEGEVPMGAIDGQILGPVIEQTPDDGCFEGASMEDGSDKLEQGDEDTLAKGDSDHVPAPSFLKRFSSWIIPTNDIRS
jgi:hypothetical protein